MRVNERGFRLGHGHVAEVVHGPHLLLLLLLLLNEVLLFEFALLLVCVWLCGEGGAATWGAHARVRVLAGVQVSCRGVAPVAVVRGIAAKDVTEGCIDGPPVDGTAGNAKAAVGAELVLHGRHPRRVRCVRKVGECLGDPMNNAIGCGTALFGVV